MGHLASKREVVFTDSTWRMWQAPCTGSWEQCHRDLSVGPESLQKQQICPSDWTTWVFQFIQKKKKKKSLPSPEKQRYLLKATQQVPGEWFCHGVPKSPDPTNAPRLLETIVEKEHLLGMEISEGTREHKTRHSEPIPESAALCPLLSSVGPLNPNQRQTAQKPLLSHLIKGKERKPIREKAQELDG